MQEFGYRAGTENVAGIVGMAEALRVNVKDIKKNITKLQEIEKNFFKALSESGIKYKRNGINHIPGNISISIPDQEGEVLLHRLDLMGIYVSTGSACDSKNTQISHVLEAIQLDKNLAEGTIRISFGKDNTINDAINIVNALKKIIG